MSGMTGRSRKPPKGDVRPLGTRPLPARRELKTKVPKFVKTAAYASLPVPEGAPWIHEPSEAEAEATKKLFAELNERASKVEAVQIASPEMTLAEAQKVVDTPPAIGVSLPQSPVTAPNSDTFSRSRTMTLTLKGLSKNRKNAFYSGAASVLRFPLSAFVNKTAPQAIEVEGDFAEQKVKLTAEERKAAQVAKPKPTLAQKIAQREAALAKLKAQAADASM